MINCNWRVGRFNVPLQMKQFKSCVPLSPVCRGTLHFENPFPQPCMTLSHGWWWDQDASWCRSGCNQNWSDGRNIDDKDSLCPCQACLYISISQNHKFQNNYNRTRRRCRASRRNLWGKDQGWNDAAMLWDALGYPLRIWHFCCTLICCHLKCQTGNSHNWNGWGGGVEVHTWWGFTVGINGSWNCSNPAARRSMMPATGEPKRATSSCCMASTCNKYAMLWMWLAKWIFCNAWK